MQKYLFLLSMALLMGISKPAEALPGQTLSQLKAWVHNHPFLPPNLIEATNEPGVFWVDRMLTNGKKIRFEAWLEKGKVIGENIYVFVPEEGKDTLNLFDRRNNSTIKLIELIYGSAIAKDFQNSKFVFEGFNYYQYDSITGKRERLATPIRNNFFQGKHVYGSAYNPIYEKTWIFTLTPLKTMNHSIVELKQEKQIFLKEEQSIAIQAEKARQKTELQELLKRRTEPADIDL